MKMENDVNRFRKIVRGQVKNNLRRFMSQGELIGKQGKKSVSIPLPRIQIPKFYFGSNQNKGIGQGQGQPGDAMEEGAQPGNNSGEHSLDVDVTYEELVDILQEELELPNIEDKGQKSIPDNRPKYSSILKTGPESLKNFKKTYKEAIKRQISLGTYDPNNPIVIPVKEDKRYRSYKIETKPHANAVIIYIMDVSGSMGDEQKEIVRLTSFWINLWLKHHYKHFEARFIIHDAQAKEVDEETFFHTKESGGTLISSAYKVCQNLLRTYYPFDQWNVYLFQFSDGDNWSGQDTELCLSMLENELIPYSNMFCYGQVESRYGSGSYLKEIEANRSLDTNEKLIKYLMRNKEDIPLAIKAFLGKGY